MDPKSASIARVELNLEVKETASEAINFEIPEFGKEESITIEKSEGNYALEIDISGR